MNWTLAIFLVLFVGLVAGLLAYVIIRERSVRKYEEGRVYRGRFERDDK